jgi:SAM-dependent methyltransferase
MLARFIDGLKLKRLKKKAGEEYSKYLDLQFKRSREKFDQGSDRETKRKEELIDIVADYVDLKMLEKALVVGCRNSYELDLLEARGVNETVGIDLFSHDRRIQAMDMHEMRFGNHVYDLVYCSHALEHAFDPGKVCGEMARVLKKGGVIVIEVPINYEVRGSDMHDFGSADTVAGLFSDYGNTKILFGADVSKGDNHSGTDVARVVIKMD